MNRKTLATFIAIYCLAAALGFFLTDTNADFNEADHPVSYIVQGSTTEAVVAAVESVNGKITHEFSIINAVAACLTVEQRDSLMLNPAVLAINVDEPAAAVGFGNG